MALVPGVSAAASAGGFARYWRVLINSNNGSSFKAIGEIEFHSSIGGGDITGSGTASASSFFSASFSPDKAFDNVNTTWWSSTNGASFPQWVKYDFGSKVKVVELALTSLNNADQTQTPKDFDVEFSNDNSTWTKLFVVTNQTGWSANETRTFS